MPSKISLTLINLAKCLFRATGAYKQNDYNDEACDLMMATQMDCSFYCVGGVWNLNHEGGVHSGLAVKIDQSHSASMAATESGLRLIVFYSVYSTALQLCKI